MVNAKWEVVCNLALHFAMSEGLFANPLGGKTRDRGQVLLTSLRFRPKC
jgi:hypothetical protein